MSSATFIALANVTLSSGDPIITFSNIPNTYKDLFLIWSGTNDNTTTGIRVQFNGNSGTYVTTAGGGNGSSSLGVQESYSAGQPSYWAAFGDRGTCRLDIMDYSSPNKFKECLARADGSSTVISSFTWQNNSPITSIDFYSIGQFQTNSTCALYGIAG